MHLTRDSRGGIGVFVPIVADPRSSVGAEGRHVDKLAPEALVLNVGHHGADFVLGVASEEDVPLKTSADGLYPPILQENRQFLALAQFMVRLFTGE